MKTENVLNPGIQRFVAVLREAGFQTVDSGDGATHDFECDRPVGYVSMLVAPPKLVSECTRLLHLLAELGICVEQISPAKQPSIQGTYDPANDTAVIDLNNVHDRMLPESK